MREQLSWKVGGQQGQGMESTDKVFSSALARLGYYLYSYRHFSSRILGGHANNNIRISTRPIRSVADHLDVLVALDQESIDVNAMELKSGGIVIADEIWKPVLPNGVDACLLPIPITAIAQEAGSTLFKNMAASGASWALLGLPMTLFFDAIARQFAVKGEMVIQKNMEAAAKGAECALALTGGPLSDFQIASPDGREKLFLIGNDAIGMGAIAAGCRFMPAYPITPATEIMEYMMKHLPAYGGTVIQTEDEIAAITMAIGANYGGVRAFTASAGPGLSLMMEGIGLAGMTETPVVIVDTQRGGPSTGLPTKQEQSDVLAMIHGTHGEIPKIVLAPSTVEECFYDTVEAFNLAERYQCPVIVLTDLQLSMGKQTSERFDYSRIVVDRGSWFADTKESSVFLPEDEHKEFRRYEMTTDGISPRAMPGMKHSIHHVTGVEHDEHGRASESATNRKQMMEKRMRKLLHMTTDNPLAVDTPHSDPDLLLIGMGSTRGVMDEARIRMEAEGIRSNRITVRQLHPFPVESLRPLLLTATTIVIIEHNATGQLASLIRLHFGSEMNGIKSLLKYDGTAFLPNEVTSFCRSTVMESTTLKDVKI
ncbi:2-oxoacid:acceptor oxidoreductase subunit alpha [Paenibacillus sp. UNC451MF]|uniref:2-oxoacid:acceptor oxidoreductase subunit alpha n=1 Tax=Paenibacillus sp. UNC451MF TaxID=1449063 RepID=UPI00056A2B8C|nr:2-oxoacid:acceptor oxidoreductase subunit alpha [Paenibacillus sp. UNC451MF]